MRTTDFCPSLESNGHPDPDMFCRLSRDPLRGPGGAAGGRRFTASSRASVGLRSVSNERVLLVEQRLRPPPLTPLSRSEDARSRAWLRAYSKRLDRFTTHGVNRTQLPEARDAFVLSPASIARRAGLAPPIARWPGPRANGLDDCNTTHDQVALATLGSSRMIIRLFPAFSRGPPSGDGVRFRLGAGSRCLLCCSSARWNWTAPSDNPVAP